MSMDSCEQGSPQGGLIFQYLAYWLVWLATFMQCSSDVKTILLANLQILTANDNN